MPTSSATPTSPSATVRLSANSGTPSTKMPTAIDSPRAPADTSALLSAFREWSGTGDAGVDSA